jgi:hypothetical protein
MKWKENATGFICVPREVKGQDMSYNTGNEKQ